MISNLQFFYDEVRGDQCPYVEFLFCWFSQDENERMWTMYDWKFQSPNFKHNGNGKFQVPNQIGSGRKHQNYQDSLNFLTGEQEKRNQKYTDIYSNNPEMIIWTITKYRNFLINQARQENYEGVSKSFYSLEAIMHYDKLYTQEDSQKIRQISKLIGFELEPKYVDGDPIFGVEFDKEKLYTMASEDPKRLEEVYKTIHEINERINLKALFEPPEFKELFHQSDAEIIDDTICSTWEEFEKLLSGKYKINFTANGITATA
jgi:hypothetical protein